MSGHGAFVLAMVAYAVGFTNGSPMHHEAVLGRTSIVKRLNYMVSSKISQPSRNEDGLYSHGDPISETAARRTRRLQSGHRCDKTSPSSSSASKPTPTPSPITHDAPPSQASTASPTRSPVVHTCSNGTPGIESNGACCPIKCGQCGGPGCSTLAAEFMLGASDCCQNTVLENGIPCGEAPCSLIAVAPTSTPTPAPATADEETPAAMPVSPLSTAPLTVAPVTPPPPARPSKKPKKSTTGSTEDTSVATDSPTPCSPEAPTAAPLTPAAPTSSPTPPLTKAPVPTPTPPLTPAPSTVDPTAVPLTPAAPTSSPTLPSAKAPIPTSTTTPAPLTAAPLTVAPTAPPLTPAAPTSSPTLTLTKAPVPTPTTTPAPLTPAPLTVAPTAAPLTPAAPTSSPTLPSTKAPVHAPTTTPAPLTPAPLTVAPTAAPLTPAAPTSSPTLPSTKAPVPAPTTTPAPLSPAPLTVAPTAAPLTPAAPTSSPTLPSTKAPVPAPTTPPVPLTPAPITVVAPTPAPVPPTPVAAPSSSCDGGNPCQNGGSCSTDPAGGYFCSCAEGFAGMICQINTDGLPPWYIELDFEGEDFTDDLKAIFQRSAARWERVILYTPGGGAPSTPAGRLLITVTIVAKDGKGGILGSAGPTGTWWEYPSISYSGIMEFDTADVEAMVQEGSFEGVVAHEMGHVIGIGTLWGECSNCYASSGVDGHWYCPAAAAVFGQLTDSDGTDADIIEVEGGSGTTCGHLSQEIFEDELMTGYVTPSGMPLSKLSCATLEDIGYIVTTEEADDYTMPYKRGLSLRGDDNRFELNDEMASTTINVMHADGKCDAEGSHVVPLLERPFCLLGCVAAACSTFCWRKRCDSCFREEVVSFASLQQDVRRYGVFVWQCGSQTVFGFG